MMKHSAILAVLVAVLVGSLLYCISPDEVQIACAGLERKMSEAGSQMLSIVHHGVDAADALRLQPVQAPVARRLLPDPFRPFGPPPATGLRSIWLWLDRAETLSLLPLAGAALWLRGRVRKRRFRSAAEQKMAGTLSKAVKQMSGRKGTTLRTIHDA